MIAVFWNMLMRMRGSILGWGIGLSLLALLVVPLFDTVAAEAEQIERMVRSFPPALMAFFGGGNNRDLTNFADPVNYLTFRFFGLVPLFMGITMVMMGSGVIVGDEENGTLDLVQAHPVSRTGLYWGRVLAFVMALTLILAIAWVGLVLSAQGTLIAETITPLELIAPFLSLGGLMLFLGLLGTWLALALPARRIGAMVANLIFITSYFLTTMTSVSADLEQAARFSPMTYYQSGDAIRGLEGDDLAILLGGALLFALLGWWVYERRDIALSGESSWRLPVFRRSTT